MFRCEHLALMLVLTSELAAHPFAFDVESLQKARPNP